MDLCDVALPYTLIGVLLWPPPRHPGAVACAGRFLRDYASRATNALLWIALISVTTLLFRRLARLVRLWVQGSRIPGPPSTPFLALIPGCGSLGNLSGYLSDLHDKYGPIVRLWLSPTQLLVSVRDTRLIKEMLIKADDKLPLTGRAFHLAFGKSSLFVSSFHKVQKRRESLAEYMNRRLSVRTNFIPSKVVECVIDRVDTITAVGLLDCVQISRQLTFFALGSTFFGDAFLDWPNARIYEELLTTIAKDGCFWASYSVPPFWSRGYWNYQYMCNRLRHLTQDMINYCIDKYDSLSQTDHRSYRENKDIAKDARLDASVLLDNMRSGGLFLEEMEEYFISKDEPCGNILGLMFHGCLAFASLISSILTRLVMHTDLQEKLPDVEGLSSMSSIEINFMLSMFSYLASLLQLYLEIVAVQGKTSKLDLHDVEKMNLLMATIYESARLWPAGPLLQRCSLKHDIYLSSGVTVPVGAILVVPLQLVQTDNSIWGKDASQFNPYRFLSEGKECIGICKEHEGSEKSFSLSELNKNAAFLTFGYGTRACVGEKLTILGISALIAALLQNYEIRFQPGLDSDPKPILNDCVLKLLPSPKIFFAKRSQR